MRVIGVIGRCAVALWAAAGVWCAVAAPAPTPSAGAPIRIAVSVPGGNVSLLRGIRFGVEEANHTAALLGRRVELATEGAGFAIREPLVTIAVRGKAFRIAPGTAGKVAWHPALKRFGAGELNERFLRQTGHPMDEQAWLGWVAVKIVAEAALRGRDLSRIRIDGHKGVPLSFDEAGVLVQPLYAVKKGALVE